MRTMQDIQDQLFKIKDKIKYAEMFIAHAKADALELDEMILDMQEDEWLERIAK